MVPAPALTGIAMDWGDLRLSDRFWSNTSPCPISGCWHWIGSFGGSSAGEDFPRMKVKQVTVSARRLAFATLHGIDRKRLRGVVRTCGTHGCCNPGHATVQIGREEWTRRYARTEKYKAGRKRTEQKSRRKHGYRWHLRRAYGLSIDDVASMLSDQGGRCAICLAEFGATAGVAARHCVDHDHGTGVVRGLLCFHCNSGLGHFRDRIERLSRAISYLARHNVEAEGE